MAMVPGPAGLGRRLISRSCGWRNGAPMGSCRFRNSMKAHAK